jgi:hypothetical protein
MNKFFRRKIDGRCVEDSQTIDNIEHNSEAGGQKNMEVGPGLVFIGDASSELIVNPGDQLFFFKSTTGFGWVKMSKTSGIGAVGSVPADDTFPIEGEGFTRYSAVDYKYIKASSGVYLYVLRDDNQLRINP